MGKLTALKIRSLTEPGGYSDGHGLFLEINGKGAASWILVDVHARAMHCRADAFPA